MKRAPNLPGSVNAIPLWGDLNVDQNPIQIVEALLPISARQGGPQRTQKGTVTYDRYGLALVNQSREMSREPVPVRRSIAACCRCIFGYCAILCKVWQRPRPTPEHETSRLPGSSQIGTADQTVIDVKPLPLELPEEKGPVEARDAGPVDRESRISQTLAELDIVF